MSFKSVTILSKLSLLSCVGLFCGAAYSEGVSETHVMPFGSFSSNAGVANSTNHKILGIVAGSNIPLGASSALHQQDTFVYYISSQSVEVCSDEDFEPNNSIAAANFILPNSTNTRSICKAGDEDWFRFTIQGSYSVSIEAVGDENGDTRMWLYSKTLAQLDSNNDRADGGNGQPNTSFYSKITYDCNSPLNQGTYYVKIDEFGNDHEIAEYQLSFNVSPTMMVMLLILMMMIMMECLMYGKNNMV